MDIRWSYYLIIALYCVLGILKWLNGRDLKTFKNTHQEIVCFKGVKKDFFATVAIICTVITVAINGAALMAGKPFILSSVFITLCIIGMALLTTRIQVLTTNEGRLWVDGTSLLSSDIKEVIIKEKKAKTQYQIVFENPINGYDGVAFALSGEQRQAFTTYIQTI